MFISHENTEPFPNDMYKGTIVSKAVVEPGRGAVPVRVMNLFYRRIKTTLSRCYPVGNVCTSVKQEPSVRS